MSRYQFLHNVLGFARSRRDRRPARQQSLRARLLLEPLEDRLVPSGADTSQQLLPTAVSHSVSSVNSNPFVVAPPPPAPVTISVTVTPASTLYNPNSGKDYSVEVSATVTTPNGRGPALPVTGGTITFSDDLQGFGSQQSNPIPVIDGTTGNFKDIIPGALAEGQYVFTAKYSGQQKDFLPGSATATFTVTSRPAKIKANDIETTFTPVGKLNLVVASATVDDTSANPILFVSEGKVRFSVEDARGINPIEGNVVNGVGFAVFDTEGEPVGKSTFSATYLDFPANFAGPDGKATLTIKAAKVGVNGNNANVAFGPQGQTETVALSANLSDLSTLGATVDEGTVKFKVAGIGTVQGAVSDGIATADITVPRPAAGTTVHYAIGVSYSDPSTGDFVAVSNTGATLTVTAPPSPPPSPSPPPCTCMTPADAQNALIQAFDQLISDIQSLFAQFFSAESSIMQSETQFMLSPTLIPLEDLNFPPPPP